MSRFSQSPLERWDHHLETVVSLKWQTPFFINIFWPLPLRKRCMFPSHCGTERRRNRSILAASFVPWHLHLLSSHIICLHPAPLLSSICPRSKRAVSHFVMSVPKPHFLSRNTLAGVCTAITCWIIGLSPTISWETRDGGPPQTHPGTWLSARWTHKYRTFPKKNQPHYMFNFISWSRPMASAKYISFALMMKQSSEHTSEESLNCWQIVDPPDNNIKISKDGLELTWDCRVWWLRIESSINYIYIVSPLAWWEALESVPPRTDHLSVTGRTRSHLREIYSLNQRARAEHANSLQVNPEPSCSRPTLQAANYSVSHWNLVHIQVHFVRRTVNHLSFVRTASFL